jgi:hypothetical protein
MLDESEFGVELCLAMSVMIVMIVFASIIGVYMSDVFLIWYFKCVLSNDNNFRNIRLNINTITPHIKLRDMELLLNETNKTQTSIIQIRYVSIRKLDLSIKQIKEEAAWKFGNTDPPMGEFDITFLKDQLKFLFNKGFHILSIYAYMQGNPHAIVTIRLGEFDIKQFHWFIMYMRKLLFNLEKRVRNG